MYDIRYIRGHFEGYDDSGKFVCSGDTERECIDEMDIVFSATSYNS